jgi:hypothetical protein
MHYTLLFLFGFFFSTLVFFTAAAETDKANNCHLSLNTRLELQSLQYTWELWHQLPKPFWLGFAPPMLIASLGDSDCRWILTSDEPPLQSFALPDFKQVYVEALAIEPEPALRDLPSFCRPFASGFRSWAQSGHWVDIDALKQVNETLSGQAGAWQRELLALERALQAGDIEKRKEWLRLYLASREMRWKHSQVFRLNLRRVENESERILGLESWLCLRLEEVAAQAKMPSELKYLNLYRNPIELISALFHSPEESLAEHDRLRRAGLIQVLLLEKAYPDWQARLQNNMSFAELLSLWSGFDVKNTAILAAELLERFPEKQVHLPSAEAFSKQKGFLVRLELAQTHVDLRPQHLLGLSPEQSLFLPGSEVLIRHNQLWAKLSGLTRITVLPHRRLRVEFVLALRSLLEIAKDDSGADSECQILRLKTKLFELQGRCLRGQWSTESYTLQLP